MNTLHTVILAAVASAVSLAGATVAEAGSITSPVGATILVGEPDNGDIVNTYNGNGLLFPFTSGVTDFGSYVATNPLHSPAYLDYEWLSAFGASSASVFYDMGAPVRMSALAFWNEDAGGVGSLALSTSNDAITWTIWATGLAPTNQPVSSNYGVDVFNLTERTARFVLFDLTQCPQPNSATSQCGIGEVAFNVVTATPEPASLALLAAGLLGLAASRRAA